MTSDLNDERIDGHSMTQVRLAAQSPFEPNVCHLGEKIFGYLSVSDLKQCRTVCKQWNDVASSILWESTEVRSIKDTVTGEAFSTVMSSVSSQKIMLSFSFQPTKTAKNWESENFTLIPQFLVEVPIVDMIKSITVDFIQDVRTLRRLLTELPNLKRMKAAVDASRFRSFIRGRDCATDSSVQFLNLGLVKGGLMSLREKQQFFEYILSPCSKLKELELEDNSKSENAFNVILDQVYEALYQPGRLERLKLSADNVNSAIPTIFSTVGRFFNLKELDLLHWKQLDPAECKRAITRGELPPTVTTLRLCTTFWQILPEVSLMMPEIQKAGESLKNIVIRAKSGYRLPHEIEWAEEWKRMDGKLELTTARIVSEEVSERYPGFNAFKQLHSLTWVTPVQGYRASVGATPTSVKELTFKLTSIPAAVEYDYEEQETFEVLYETFAHLTNLKTVTIVLVRNVPRKPIHKNINGVQFHFL